MIFTKLEHYPLLEDFGILVPFDNSKFLTLDRELQTKYDQNPVSFNLLASKSDLKNVFQSSWIDELFENPEKSILETYELFDNEGKPHRYNPDIATKSINELFDYTRNVCEAFYQTCKLALDADGAFFIGGGLHHGYPGHGSGFCLLNDIAFAVNKIKPLILGDTPTKENQICILDVDAHMGDGTAEFFKGDPNVFTISLHMETGWPRHQQEGSKKLPSNNLDIGFLPGQEDLYLSRLTETIDLIVNEVRPEFIIIVQGSDPYELDQLESANDLKLSRTQMNQRDQLIHDMLVKNKIKYAYCMSGGYGPHSKEIYQDFFKYVLNTSNIE